MSVRPSSFVLLVSISLLTACTTVVDDGLATGPPSVQPAGSSPPEPVPVPVPVPPVRADAGEPQDTTPPADTAPAAEPPDGGLAVDAAPPPPAPDAAVVLPPDAAVSAPDASPPPPPPADDPAGSCPQRPELALCLAFEGAVRDDSPYHLTATTSGATFKAGPSGQALELAGGGALVVSPNPVFDNAAVTLEAWVQPRALGRRMGVISNGNAYTLVILPSGSAMCTGGGGYALTGDAVAPGRWTSLTCTYDADLVTLWVDGKKTAENMRNGPIRPASPTGLAVANEVPDGNVFDGLVDNVRIWREVRSARQICSAARDCTSP